MEILKDVFERLRGIFRDVQWVHTEKVVVIFSKHTFQVDLCLWLEPRVQGVLATITNGNQVVLRRLSLDFQVPSSEDLFGGEEPASVAELAQLLKDSLQYPDQEPPDPALKDRLAEQLNEQAAELGDPNCHIEPYTRGFSIVVNDLTYRQTLNLLQTLKGIRTAL